MIEITVYTIAAIVVVALIAAGVYLRKFAIRLRETGELINSQNEYYFACTQFYIDCHQYNLLTLRLYIIGVMKSATDNENYELAENCKNIIAEMEKLINASAKRNQDKE